MSKSIYVGNLPWAATEEQVQDLFAEYGKVLSVKLVSDRETGRARGFGFVEMEDGEAQAAIEALDNYSFGGRTLRVNEAKPRAPRPPRYSGIPADIRNAPGASLPGLFLLAKDHDGHRKKQPILPSRRARDRLPRLAERGKFCHDVKDVPGVPHEAIFPNSVFSTAAALPGPNSFSALWPKAGASKKSTTALKVIRSSASAACACLPPKSWRSRT